jgi:hypothetical protein
MKSASLGPSKHRNFSRRVAAAKYARQLSRCQEGANAGEARAYALVDRKKLLMHLHAPGAIICC